MNRTIRLGLLPIALALAGSLRADDQAAATPPADNQASLRADNKQLTDELAAAWKESERLKAELTAAQAASAKSSSESAELQKQLGAAQDASAKSTAEAADLQKQLDAAKAQPPPAADTASTADLQDKLTTSLRSFSVVQDENAQLKATVDKLTSDNASLSQQLEAARASIATLQVQAAATSQIEPLRTELRQAQDETSRLASENSQLRTRLAIQAPGPGAKPAPTRPAQAAAAGAAAAPEQAAPPPPPAPKTYVVAEGDTLTKISRKFYGSSGRWEDILNANRDVMKDEKSLVVGSTLKIP
jgi:LysM repeat protein